MLWFIIGILVTIGIVIYLIWEDFLGFGEILGFGFLTLIAAFFGALLLTLFASAFAEAGAEKTYHVVEDVDIYALQDNIATEGSFFLGSGHVDGELKYFYVEKTDIGYTVKHVDADQTYIKYTSDRCHIERYTYTYNNWLVNLIAVPLTDRYIIYIPEGSIVNNYTVDLK